MSISIIGFQRVSTLLMLLCTPGHPIAPQTETTGGYSEESVRKMLVNQPDYIATQQFFFSERVGGFGANSKVAKLRNRSRDEGVDQIIIHEPGKPSIRIVPSRREYSEFSVKTANEFAMEPEDIGKREDVTIKVVGPAEVNGMPVVKIEAGYKDEKLESIRMRFYIAPALKNLVVKRELNLGDQLTMVILLTDVSIKVSEDLFQIPRGYKKVKDPYIK